MGNAMFMYSAARALHEVLGFELDMQPQFGNQLAIFEALSNRPAQLRPEGWQPADAGVDLKITRHQIFDVFALAADRRARTITLDGYVHQSNTLMHFLGACRKWFQLRDAGTGFDGALAAPGTNLTPADSPVTASDVVLHLRAGDIAGNAVEATRKGEGSGLSSMPAWWFEGVLEHKLQTPWRKARGPGRIIAVTEKGGEQGEVAQRLRTEWGALVVARQVSQDFSALLHSDRMIGSCSTFSWWAAALRRKSEVHFPAFGVCDPKWKLQNAGRELVNYDAHIEGWHWHDLFEMPNKPEGFQRGYG